MVCCDRMHAPETPHMLLEVGVMTFQLAGPEAGLLALRFGLLLGLAKVLFH